MGPLIMTYTLARPVHPGQLIKDAILPDYALSISRAAEVLKVARPGFNNFLNGKAGISADLAFKLEAAFGVSSALLLNMQTRYSLWEAEQRRPAVTAGVARQEPVLDAHPA